jgi:hypothetical protein
MGHAGPDTANVRDVLLAEPHRVRFTGRALLRGPLLRGGGPRRKREREAQQHRSRGCDRPELWLGATNLHYSPPFGDHVFLRETSEIRLSSGSSPGHFPPSAAENRAETSARRRWLKVGQRPAAMCGTTEGRVIRQDENPTRVM